MINESKSIKSQRLESFDRLIEANRPSKDRAYSTLLAAFHEAEEKFAQSALPKDRLPMKEELPNNLLLRAWIEEYGVETDVVCEGDNRGNALLIACELDMPAAVAALLSLGANPNYVHPSKHGNTPLLRCAEMGYEDCLRSLLLSPGLDLMQLTKEYKLVLGQNIPQYEAGGRSALILAAESGRLSSVKLLMQHHDGETLLSSEDSFGRSPLQAVFDKMATKAESSAAWRVLDTIAHELCIYSDLDPVMARKSMLPDKATALASERNRNRILRQRFLTTSIALKNEEQKSRLAAVSKFYGTKKHPEVYSSQIPPSAIGVLSNNTSGRGSTTTTRRNDLLVPPITTGLGVTNNTNPTDSIPPAPTLVEALVAVSHEPVPGTWTLPLLSPAFCAAVSDELQHYEQLARAAAAGGGGEGRLPLPLRHDGNLGALQDVGFAPLLAALGRLLGPLLPRLGLVGPGARAEVHHAFVTRNWPGREENATFKVHRDRSDLTINVCLQASDDLEGSTVGLYRDPSANPDSRGSLLSSSSSSDKQQRKKNIESSSSPSSDNEEDRGTPLSPPLPPLVQSRRRETAGMLVPSEEDRVYTFTHAVGKALIHSGSQWHRTDPCTRGTRASLIAWARVVADVPCTGCGESIGVGKRLCKACGEMVTMVESSSPEADLTTKKL